MDSSGFAHGFLSLEDNTIVNYKVDNWNKSLERSLKWNDGEIKIKWPDLNENLQFLNISIKIMMQNLLRTRRRRSYFE